MVNPNISTNIFDDPSTLASVLDFLRLTLILPTAVIRSAAPVVLAAIQTRVPNLKYEFLDEDDV